MYSLWMAREWLRSDDFLCLNGDVLFHPAILEPAVTLRSPVSMIVDPAWRDDNMKVIIRHGKVVSMGKSISRSDYSATYLGITAFSRLIAPAHSDDADQSFRSDADQNGAKRRRAFSV